MSFTLAQNSWPCQQPINNNSVVKTSTSSHDKTSTSGIYFEMEAMNGPTKKDRERENHRRGHEEGGITVKGHVNKNASPRCFLESTRQDS